MAEGGVLSGAKGVSYIYFATTHLYVSCTR